MEQFDATFLVKAKEFLAFIDFPMLLPNPPLNEVGNTNVSPFAGTSSPGDEVNAFETNTSRTEENNERKSYYKRRKITNTYLQLQVTELTEKLYATVQAKQANAKQSPSIWKAIAKYQHQERMCAEAQNYKLRAAIDTRSRLIQDFWRLMTDRQDSLGNLTNSEAQLIEDSWQYQILAFEQTDIEILTQCMRELDTVYAQTDEALHAGGLDSVGEDWRGSGRTWKEDGSGCFLYVDKQDFPYNFQHTCKNLWRVTRMPPWGGSQGSFTGVSDPENTMAVKFRVRTRLPSSAKAQVLQRIVVVRRYEEHGRMILIWRSFAEGEGIFAGMHADETGWSVATPSKGKSKTATVLKVCIRYMPIHLRGVQSRQPIARQFTSVVLDSGTNEAVAFALALEKLLLEEA